MQDVLDQEVQKTIAYKSLFESAGWKEYESRVLEFAIMHQEKIERLTKKLVNESDREELNGHISTLLGLQYLLIVKENMLDEVESNNPPADEGAEYHQE